MPSTGATRYQKFLKSERAKTKLKRNKELPKGTNVTKTNFKVKKIVIKEQLAAHAQHEALSSKKLNLKELLSRLNHFNVNARTEGLNGLKELISTHDDVLQLHLGQLIHGVTPLIMNIEKLVRRESLKVLHLILTKAPMEKVAPFFDVMCTYLRCAMTHIDIRIQEDSLLFLDVLLGGAPERVANDFYKIIPNFIDMISKLRFDSKPGRTLTVNLGSQITSAKWRVKVLHRLQELLEKFVKLNKNSNNSNVTTKIHYFNENQVNYYPLFNANSIANCPLSYFSSKNNNDLDVIEDEADNFKKYLETLIPLLFETWLEVCPNTNKKSENTMETMISGEAAILLKHLLAVVSLLWEYVQILNKHKPTSDISKWFNGKFRAAYSQHIMCAFPYNTSIRSARDKNISTSEVFIDTITDTKMVQENLRICHLYIHLNLNINVKTQGAEMGVVLNYVENLFSRNKEEGNNNAIIKVLSSLFSTEPWGWTKHHSIMNSLFDNIVSVYFNNGTSPGFHQDIFALLCKISLDNQLGQLHKTKSYEKWIINLPDILCCESITSHTVDILHKFATQNNEVFNMIIKPKLLGILKNLPSIKMVGAVDIKETQRKLLSLMYWIKWDNDSLNYLESQLLQNAYGSANTTFIMDTLRFKSEGMFQ